MRLCGAPNDWNPANIHGGVQTVDEAIHFITTSLLSSVKHEVVVGSLAFPFITHIHKIGKNYIEKT